MVTFCSLNLHAAAAEQAFVIWGTFMSRNFKLTKQISHHDQTCLSNIAQI